MWEEVVYITRIRIIAANGNIIETVKTLSLLISVQGSAG